MTAIASKEPIETDAMLEKGAASHQHQAPAMDGYPPTPLQNGSGGHNTIAEVYNF
jgi:hypothetical protein